VKIYKHLLSFCICLSINKAVTAQEFPIAKREVTKNVYFNDTILDEYQWMENLSDTCLTNWINKQNRYTERFFSSDNNYEKALNNLKKNIVYENQEHEGNIMKSDYELTVFLSTDDDIKRGSSPTALYYKNKSGDWRELIGSDEFKKKSDDKILFTNYFKSNDRKQVFACISRNGTDWEEIYIINMKTKKITDTIVDVISTNIIPFNDGFFYQRKKHSSNSISAIKGETMLYYHKFSERQNSDKFLYAAKRVDLFFNNDSAIIIKTLNTKNLKDYISLSAVKQRDLLNIDTTKFKPFLYYNAKFRYELYPICLINDSLYMTSNFHHSNGMVEKYNINSLDLFDTVIQPFSEILVDTYYYDGKFHCIYYKDQTYSIVSFNSQGIMINRKKFPRFYYLTSLKNFNNALCEFSVCGFNQPEAKYILNLNTYSIKFISNSIVKFNIGVYEQRCIEYSASDGVKIPIILTYKKGIDTLKPNPLLYSAYGGFGHISDVEYNYSTITFLESGGIYAFASIRGGGEKGKNWHLAGARTNKLTSLNDFIEGAAFLVKSKITDSTMLAITGASNGGILVANAINKRPQLFKAAICEVGVYDMFRYQNYSYRDVFADEYGLSSDSYEYTILKNYSPYHNIQKQNYPSILILTGENDDRVVPFHSYKFTARLQALRPLNPTLLYVLKSSGHSTVQFSDFVTESAIKLAFLFKELNMKVKFPK
jgi:prolyl oligopeptidase